jgi:3-isopropylmalate/(R)-2-methylmalate dehydratase small subunit
VNNGVLPIACPEAVDAIEQGETISVDLDKLTITRISTPSSQFDFSPLSPSVMAIIDAGGLIPMLRKRLGTEHLPMPEIKFASE